MKTASELFEQLNLPVDNLADFELNFEESVADFTGVPEHMTMEFVRKYYPWVGGDEAHYTVFERVANKVAQSVALQLYAHHAHKVLYVYEAGKSNYPKWPLLTDALQDDNGMFDFMTAMSAIPLWCETHRKLGIPEEYSRASAQWLNGTLQIYNSARPNCYGIDRGQSYWLRFNIEGRLFRIGRFEYMIGEKADRIPTVFRHKASGEVIALCGENWGLLEDGSRVFLTQDEEQAPIHTQLIFTDDTVTGTYISPTGVAVPDDVRTLSLSEYTRELDPESFLLDMHIPGGGAMSVDAAYESWHQSIEFFAKYLKKDVKGISCVSWIFNTDFIDELPNSNLSKLMQEVYLFPERRYGEDGMFFIFGKHEGSVLDCDCNNSIRQAFYNIVKSGKLLHTGGMFILPEEIKNRSRYLCMN